VKLTFLGTRGEIEPRTAEHRMHTSVLITFRRKRIMIDCGADWASEVDRVRPDAIVLTHAHPDHISGLTNGIGCPVFATPRTWDIVGRWPIPNRATVNPRDPFGVHAIKFEAFELEHSLRAPAVGYRIGSGAATIFYSPDVAKICERHEALSGIRVYIGDGAAITRPILRKRDGVLIGHASIAMQLEWCKAEHVPAAIFTHCGTEIVSGEPMTVQARLDVLSSRTRIRTRIAVDGFELNVA